MPPTRQRSSGRLLAARQVDARELEQRDVLVAGVDVLARSRDQALEQRRAENRLIAAHRIGQADRSRVGVGGDEAPRVRLAEPGTDEHVLDQPPQPLLAGQVTGDRAAQRHRVRHPVEHDAGDLLDQVDLARDVARAHTWGRSRPSRRRPRTRAARGSRAARRRGSRARRAARCARAGGGRRGVAAGRRARRRCRRARPRRDRRSSCSRARPRARRDTGRCPSPSGSSPPCGGRAAPRSSARRSARSSPPRAAPRSSSSTTSLLAPPMIAASATGFSPSVISRSRSSTRRTVPSSVCTSSPARACRTTIRPPASCERSKACSGLP